MEVNQSNLKHFLEANKSKVLSIIKQSDIKAQILDDKSEEDMKQAGELLRNGKLVSFPTETVYGLGANALDEEAVKSIFVAKNRPLTDPVIVHIDKKEDGLNFVDITPGVKEVYDFLADNFWPGPLTIILKANFNIIPRVVTAQTDFVGIRCPQHEVARRLIRIAQRPIAAPSANLFAHVSPTSAVHVFNDFYDQNICIINDPVQELPSCEFGIESTVVKIEEIASSNQQENSKFNLVILRFGSLSGEQMAQAVSKSEQFKDRITIVKKNKENKVAEHIHSEAPGQLLKHYSPYINCYLFHLRSTTDKQDIKYPLVNDINMKESIIFDYKNQTEHLKDKCMKYISLSEKGDMREIMTKLYDSLRWAENVDAAKNILIYNIDHHYTHLEGNDTQKVEFLETVYDKIFRSTSGKKILYDQENDKFYLVEQHTENSHH
ncbi:hypothetical protein ABPG72_002113 [Tetrahymena utriculariae]